MHLQSPLYVAPLSRNNVIEFTSGFAREEWLCRPYAPMMQEEQLLRGQSKLGICLAFVVHELDFKHTVSQAFNDSANLSTHQSLLWHIREQRHHVEI